MSSEISCDEPSRTTPLTPADILNAAADLLEKPGAWTQGALAKDVNGRACEPEDGACFCLQGALTRVVGRSHRIWWDAFNLLERQLPKPPRRSDLNAVATWNDHPDRTQAEVVAALRKAATLSGEPSQ